MSLLRKTQQATTTQNTSDEAKSTVGKSPGLLGEEWSLQQFKSKVTSNCFLVPDVEHMRVKKLDKPWKTDLNYFKDVKVTALAALKMFIHAKKGSPNLTERRTDWYEVMGLMIGHFYENTIYITDSFSLPVEANQVECTMNEESLIYQSTYLNYHRNLGKADAGCIGWYHSHPGYTCFLSGIDVNTQREGQVFQDPWLSIVVDPVRTIATGQLDLKAFRTYPTNEDRKGSQTLTESIPDMPSKRIKEYGVHANCYYELPISLVRTEGDKVQLDALLQQYWSVAFSTNPLLANYHINTEQIDLTAQLTRMANADVLRRNRARAVRTEKWPAPNHILSEKEKPIFDEASASLDPTYSVYQCGGGRAPLYQKEIVGRLDIDTDAPDNKEEEREMSLAKRARTAGEAVSTEIWSSTIPLEVKETVFASLRQ